MADAALYIWFAVVVAWCPALGFFSLYAMRHTPSLRRPRLAGHVRMMIVSYLVGGGSTVLGAGAVLGIPQLFGTSSDTVILIVVGLMAAWAAFGIKGLVLLLQPPTPPWDGANRRAGDRRADQGFIYVHKPGLERPGTFPAELRRH